ncbi:hypothetical protein ACOSP7_010493 [Xanthoceras sorbifolium]|uniref:Phytosulfokine n=1 Tax=Xanthoceras sorbifolium TaxID=99658 RepID=A0ABQ8HTG8_9ROSI|nr:hypothetical protein JRO89_XS07G0091400 [Xanthoceras sorbifolium]
MSKLSTHFMVALLLCTFMLANYATARPEPGLAADSLMKSHHLEEEEKAESESCDGVGKEECLMRRTLAAHVDYIYTQNHHP